MSPGTVQRNYVNIRPHGFWSLNPMVTHTYNLIENIKKSSQTRNIFFLDVQSMLKYKRKLWNKRPSDNPTNRSSKTRALGRYFFLCLYGCPMSSFNSSFHRAFNCWRKYKMYLMSSVYILSSWFTQEQAIKWSFFFLRKGKHKCKQSPIRLRGKRKNVKLTNHKNKTIEWQQTKPSVFFSSFKPRKHNYSCVFFTLPLEPFL